MSRICRPKAVNNRPAVATGQSAAEDYPDDFVPLDEAELAAVAAERTPSDASDA